MSNSSSCFFPDGVTNGFTNTPNFVPCDPSAPVSPCCAIGETCVGSGLCLSSNGLIYRGGCTDTTFESSSCPSLCTDASGRNAGPQDSWIFLKACDASTGKLQWVCDLTGNCSDTTMRFDLLVGGVKEVNITGSLATSSSSSSSLISSSTSTSLPTSSSITLSSATSTAVSNATKECSTKTGVSAAAVGAGVGIPLLIIALLSIAWALWERRRSSRYEIPIQIWDDTVPVTDNKSIRHEAPHNIVRTELPPSPHGYTPTHELS